MGLLSLESVESTRSLANAARLSDEPVIVVDGDDECLVALSPEVLDRLLFDVNLLNVCGRDLSWY